MDNLRHGYVNLARFWKNVRKTDTCWLWTSKCTGGPYGRYGLGYVRVMSKRGPAVRMEGAHRISYELTYGPIPGGKQVMHSCDNGLCVRSDHLSIGSAADNAADKAAKGRQIRGEQVNTAKLTPTQVITIRKRYKAGEFSIDLGREYGLIGKTIETIAFGRSWKHVGGPISKPLGRGFRKARKQK